MHCPKLRLDFEIVIPNIVRLVAASGLIFANAFFVAVEFALVSVDRTRVDEQAKQGSRNALNVQRLLGRLSYHLSGAQLGITLTSLLLGALAEPAVASLIDPILQDLFVSVPAAWSIAVALILATVVQMVLGELVPKSLATSHPLRSSTLLARATLLYGFLARPVIAALDGLAVRLTRALGVEPAEELDPIRDREEIEFLIRSSGEQGTLDAGEVDLLTRSIRLAGKSADVAMVPRVQVITIAQTATVEQLVSLAIDSGHSRFPVTGAGLDDVVGVVHVKSVHTIAVHQRPHTQVVELMGSVLAIPEARGLDDLLGDLREGGQQLAIVIDEHGGTAGIITLEDVLEEIVGEITDEYDPPLVAHTKIEAIGSTVIPASLHPDEVRDATGFVMPEGEYETLAGLVLDRLGRIPEPGAICTVNRWRLEVVAMERLRVASVRVVAPVTK